MPRQKLVVEEHSSLRGVSLSEADVVALRSGPARLEVERRRDGRFDVRARQIVGTVRTATVDLVIRPKVSVDGFLEMLGHAPGIAELRGAASMDRWRELVPALAELYARSLEIALRRGVLQGYRSERDALTTCRGRIDGLHLATRRFGVIPPIECEFEEFSPDVEVNQRLLAAATSLLQAGFGSDFARHRLRVAVDRLEGVTLRRFRAPLPPIPVERRFTRYGAAVDLANLILSATSVELNHGEVASVGFLVNMNDLYEAWVAAELGRALRASFPRWRRHPPRVHLDHDRQVKLAPDVLWTPHGAPKLPIDAKYKRGEDVPNPDVYQMAAYCAGLGVRRGVLFCVDVKPRVLRLMNGVEIHVRRLSIEGDSGARREAVEREAAHLLRLAFRA